MKNNKIISTLFICSFLICACGKSTKDLTESQITKFYKKAPNQTQDVSSSISGRWLWKAIKEDKQIAEGLITLKEQDGGKLSGTNRLAIVVKNKSDTGIVIQDIPLSGSREANQVNLSLKNLENQEVKSIATLSNKGHIMQGESKEPVPLPQDPKHIMEYKWIAVKISDK